MAIIAKEGKTSNFAPHPTGLYQFVCCDVVDMGELEVTFSGKTKKQHKVRVVWQSEEKNPDNEGRPFQISKRYTLSLHEKSGLRKDLESWRGRPFTKEELAGFDLEKLIGVNAFINIIHVEKEGTTYANVASISQIKRGVPVMTVMDYVRMKDRPDAPPETVPEELNGHPLGEDDWAGTF